MPVLGCLVPRSRTAERYLHSPIRLHGMVLNELSIEDILLLPGIKVRVVACCVVTLDQ
jgi:hypothetical protein